MRVCPSCGACFEDEYDLCAYDGEALRLLFSGPRVLAGRYLLEQSIAAGAMGTVFRATHLQIGSTIAVKLMQPERDALQVGLARFHREAQILGQIKHPNAVLVMDFGVEERPPAAVPFLVTEFLRGEPLSTVLRRQELLSLEQAERIIAPVCEAVEEAHQVGVIHRDIKPSNIFVEQLRDGSEVIKVLDFGIAKFVELAPEVLDRLKHENAALARTYRRSLDVDLLEEVAAVRSGEPSTRLVRHEALGHAPTEPPSEWTITEAGFMIGTIPYMAPEQMTGERVSRQTDIYGIATLLYQLLTGHLPFEGSDDQVILAKLGDEALAPGQLGVELPAPLEQTLLASLAMDPADRPESALELARALRGANAAASRARAEDVPRDLEAQLIGAGRAALLVEKAIEAFETAGSLEEGYQLVRDRILGLGGPLDRVGALLDAVPRELLDEQRRRLMSALEEAEQALAPIGRSLHGLEIGQGDEYLEYLHAIWAKAQLAASQRLEGLRARIATPEALTVPAEVVFNPFAGVEEESAEILATLARRLLGADPLDSQEAFEQALGRELDRLLPFLAEGTHRSSACLEELVCGLWQHADTLLLMELHPSGRPPRLMPLLATLRAVEAARPFVAVGELFSGTRDGEVTAEHKVTQTVQAFEGDDEVRVIWRCLLAHPHAQVRALAARELAPGELWNVVVFARVPIPTLRSVFDAVVDRASAEYLKIFFFCTRDRLLAAARPDEIEETFGLLARFFEVPSFHEDVVFDPLLELDRSLRVRCRDSGITTVAFGDYDELLADFVAEGETETEALEQMRDIPLAIQRKVAREGHFLDHFVSHPNERVAREALPHLLRRDDVIRFLRVPTIHRSVLTELSRHRRFFRKQAARLALLQNPKTPGQVARIYLPLIAHEQIRLLAKNKHVGADVRGLARAYLERLKKRGE